MKRYHLLLLVLISLFTQAAVAEPDTHMSFQSYSGLINTPTAKLFDEGKLYIQYGNQVETRIGYRTGENYNFGIGLWEYVEVSARLAEYQTQGNNRLSNRDEGDMTDLSANIKLGIPFIPKDWFRLAVGIQDIGGAANYFDAKYAVASKTLFDNIDVSLGLGESDSQAGRLNGAFAGIAWQPFSWGKVSLEHDAADTNVALHLVSPQTWFDNGLQLSTNVIATSSSDELADDFYYSLGLRIPLGYTDKNSATKSGKTITKKKPQQKTSFKKTSATVPNKQITGYKSATINNQKSMRVENETTALQNQVKLKKLLVSEGFERIKVVEANPRTIYVELENHLYNRNQIDGIGVALGIISTNVQQSYTEFKLVMKEREIPVLVVSGNLAEYELFLSDNQALKIKVSTDTFAEQADIPAEDANRSDDFWLKPRLTFSPDIVSTIGTEVGVFDASLAWGSHLELPLWRGAAVTAKHVVQLTETKYFEDGEVFADSKQKTGVQNYSFHQTFSLPYSLKNMTSVGRARDSYNYVANELRWQSFEGSHQFNLHTARYENQIIPERDPYAGCNILFTQCWPPKEPQERDVMIAAYKYYHRGLSASAELQIGQYWQQDKGMVVKVERMFGDVSVNLIYKDTQIEDNEANQFIGLGFSIPLTPRKDYNNKYFQVRGKPRWNYTATTLVGKSHNQLTPGTADSATLFYNLDSAFYNNDRLSKSYIYQHAERLKDAYFQVR